MDASGQTVCYIYGRDVNATATAAQVVDFDTARKVAVWIARLPELIATSRDYGETKRH